MTMKQLFLILFLVSLNSFLLSAQNMFLNNIHLEYTNGAVSNTYYKYDDDWKLDSIIEMNQYGDTSRLFLFNNDSLVADIQANATFWYHHFAIDSVVTFAYWYVDNLNYKSSTYYLNSDFEAVSYKTFDTAGNIHKSYTYTFEYGNCTEINSPGISDKMEYSSYLNPYLKENKYFKHNYMGSINFMKHGAFSIWIQDYIVQSSINNYPEKVDLYINDELRGTQTFEYYDRTSVKTFNTMTKILDISYYNLFGQKINKPEQGFYIEVIRTNKGTNSIKKYAY